MDQVIHLDVVAITFLIGTVIPLVTSLVTKAEASSRLKSILSLGLSVASGVLAYIVVSDYEVTVYGLIAAAVSTYLAAGVTYQNLWKPSGIAAGVSSIAPNSGFGTATPPSEQPPEPVTALVGNPVPEAHEEAKVTTLKGKSVYADASGYLFVTGSPPPREDLNAVT